MVITRFQNCKHNAMLHLPSFLMLCLLALPSAPATGLAPASRYCTKTRGSSSGATIMKAVRESREVLHLTNVIYFISIIIIIVLFYLFIQYYAVILYLFTTSKTCQALGSNTWPSFKWDIRWFRYNTRRSSLTGSIHNRMLLDKLDLCRLSRHVGECYNSIPSGGKFSFVYCCFIKKWSPREGIATRIARC